MRTSRTIANSSSRVTSCSIVGARDRKELKDVVYEVTRHKGILKKIAQTDEDYEKIIEVLRSSDFKNQRENSSFEE